jgi:DNA (cytosine-5)-methyltransferase 1
MMDERVSTVAESSSHLADAPSSSASLSESSTSASTTVVGVDLFAGAGGFSLGSISAGVDIVGALELHKNPAKTYAANIRRRNGAKPVLIEDDILSISPEEALERWSLRPNSVDIILGGPPCQGFSSHRINDAGVDDPRNKLLGRYFAYVEALRPRVFLVENVPGLLWERHED